MTLVEIIESLDELSEEEQTSLLCELQNRLMEPTETDKTDEDCGEAFWQGILSFRAAIEREGLVFTDEDFADLRDRSPGREVNL